MVFAAGRSPPFGIGRATASVERAGPHRACGAVQPCLHSLLLACNSRILASGVEEYHLNRQQETQMMAAPAAEASATLHRCSRFHRLSPGIDEFGSTAPPRRPP